MIDGCNIWFLNLSSNPSIGFSLFLQAGPSFRISKLRKGIQNKAFPNASALGIRPHVDFMLIIVFLECRGLVECWPSTWALLVGNVYLLLLVAFFWVTQIKGVWFPRPPQFFSRFMVSSFSAFPGFGCAEMKIYCVFQGFLLAMCCCHRESRSICFTTMHTKRLCVTSCLPPHPASFCRAATQNTDRAYARTCNSSVMFVLLGYEARMRSWDSKLNPNQSQLCFRYEFLRNLVRPTPVINRKPFSPWRWNCTCHGDGRWISVLM